MISRSNPPCKFILFMLGWSLVVGLAGCSKFDAQTCDCMDLDSSDGDQSLESDTEPEPLVFIEYPWEPQTAAVTTDRLCAESADPDGAEDKVWIDCRMEGESFIQQPTPPKDTLLLFAYNIERGHSVSEQLDLIENQFAGALPDVIFLSEADRGCARTSRQHTIRDYARRLKMNYVYAVEFLELRRLQNGTIKETCEHGNGILSKYPLGNVRQIRHATQISWWEDAHSRLGGRITVAADMKVGEQIIHLYSVHFESAIVQDEREAQAKDVLDDAKKQAGAVIVGGDMNAGLYFVDLQLNTTTCKTTQHFLTGGFTDSHGTLAPENRKTDQERGFILDLIFANTASFSHPQIGVPDHWNGLSDHYPIWVDYDLSVFEKREN